MSAEYTSKILENKYKVETLLGQGGMGAVYLGEHMAIKKKVAIKFLHVEFANNEQLVKRFYLEAQAATAINHDSIIDIFDVGISPMNEPYLVMEYLEGESLLQLLSRNEPLNIQTAASILEPILSALYEAHGRGIIHRDLKPENVFIVEKANQSPRIKIIDFGISKLSNSTSNDKLTQTGTILGTPAYMSPEQAKGAVDLDHRSDLFSIGVIFYQMLTGKLPFPGENFTEIIVKIMTQEPVSPADSFIDFPKEATDILTKALKKNPDDRFLNAMDFLSALKELSNNHPSENNLVKITSVHAAKTCAIGNIGSQIVQSPISTKGHQSVAAKVLASTKGIETEQSSVPVSTDNYNKRHINKSLFIILAILFFASITFGAVYVYKIVIKTDDKKESEIIKTTITQKKVDSAITVTIATNPESVKVFLKGVHIGQTPYSLQIDTKTELTLQKTGYDNKEISIDLQSPTIFVATLTKRNQVQQSSSQAKRKQQKSVSSSNHIKTKTAVAKKIENPIVQPAATIPPIPPIPPKVTKSSYDNMDALKIAYRDGKITKSEYGYNRTKIRQKREVEYQATKKLYREKKIDKAEYKLRIKNIKLKYEGRL